MAISYGNYVTPQVPNTTQQEVLRDGVLAAYRITPIEGYVYHDNRNDGMNIDGSVIRYYASTDSSIGANYDFTPRIIEINVRDEYGEIVTENITAYGEFELFALERSKVPNPEIEIYGGGNDHEVMSTGEETVTE